MFVGEIKKAYGINTPILTNEILDLFKDYTKAYVFRLIKKAEEENNLKTYSRGVYYIPKTTFFGQSTICAEMVVQKKYIEDNKSVYGIYAGLYLLNSFGITTQVPNLVEIVTNNEKTRKRIVVIDNRKFILRKSRCKITKDNYSAYTILQLFNDINENEEIRSSSKKRIKKYMKDNEVTAEKIFQMAQYFPSATLKKLAGSGVLNDAI